MKCFLLYNHLLPFPPPCSLYLEWLLSTQCHAPEVLVKRQCSHLNVGTLAPLGFKYSSLLSTPEEEFEKSLVPSTTSPIFFLSTENHLLHRLDVTACLSFLRQIKTTQLATKMRYGWELQQLRLMYVLLLWEVGRCALIFTFNVSCGLTQSRIHDNQNLLPLFSIFSFLPTRSVLSPPPFFLALYISVLTDKFSPTWKQ